MRRDNYSCNWCGSEYDLCIDHVWPFSRGGDSEHGNLQVLCKTCNSNKSDQIIWEDIKKFGIQVPKEYENQAPKDLFSCTI
jgi:5-methylcytosine-specific restriction endonuclease McrA|tara:strand:+ start:247 stop:489 length:243 start_codon:yes stop_codon:yes gene_type:complete